MGEEKTRRTRANVPIRVTTLDPERDWATGELFTRCVEETTADLSHGGAFVRSFEPLAAGRRVLVEIELDENDSISLHATVAWTQRQMKSLAPSAKVTEHPGYGIQFAPANLKGLERLQESLAEATGAGDGISRLPSTGPLTARPTRLSPPAPRTNPAEVTLGSMPNAEDSTADSVSTPLGPNRDVSSDTPSA